MLRQLVVPTAIAALAVTAVAETTTTSRSSSSNNKNNIITIDIPRTPPSTNPLPRDVYGYSIEPIWLDWYTSTPLASKLLSHITTLTGIPPPIRIGGTTSDKTYIHPSLLPESPNSSLAIPGLPDAELFNITPSWFSTWGDYFDERTDLTYTLNFADNSSDWDNAVAQSLAASAGLRQWQRQRQRQRQQHNTSSSSSSSSLVFELGNEIDHFIDKGWRDAENWGVDSYVDQFAHLTGRIVRAAHSSSSSSPSPSSPSLSPAPAPPKFQAAVFADPPWFPDQHDEIDDFDIINLTQKARIEDHLPPGGVEISSYSVHMYPQSTCDGARWSRMSLDLLSNHTVLSGQNVSQWVPQAQSLLPLPLSPSSPSPPPPLVMGETNSVSCGGRSGISDTFGAALWGVDYVLLNAAAVGAGIPRTFFHLGAQSEYSSFTPLDYEYAYTAYYGQEDSDKEKEWLESGIRAGWYGHFFVGKVVAAVQDGDGDGDGDELRIATLPGANSSVLSGFGVYSSSSSSEKDTTTSTDTLKKLVFLDMGVWNGTEGLSNPSTLSATDGKVFSEGERPVTKFSIQIPSSSSSYPTEKDSENANHLWSSGRSVRVTRLKAPGTNAKSEITVGGLRFDPKTGEALKTTEEEEEEEETLVVTTDGTVEFEMRRAEGVLLEILT